VFVLLLDFFEELGVGRFVDVELVEGDVLLVQQLLGHDAEGTRGSGEDNCGVLGDDLLERHDFYDFVDLFFFGVRFWFGEL